MPRPTIFYVYVLRDPRPRKALEPFYVGKGQGERAHFHWRYAKEHYNPLLRRVLDRIRRAGTEPMVEIIRYFDIEADAFSYEVQLIAKYGRRDNGTGILCNLTDGGEGVSGSDHLHRLFASDPEYAKARSEISRQALANTRKDPKFEETRLAAIRVRNANPKFMVEHAERMRQRNINPEFQAKRVAKLLERFADPEYAKEHSARCSESIKKRNADPAYQERCRLGRLASRECKQALSESIKKRNADPAHQKKCKAGRRIAQARRRLNLSV